jgi:hypothetical protein
MWVFLSRRIRTWVLMAIALPLLTRMVGRLAAESRRRNPAAASTRWLTRAESALISVSRRGRRRRGM